MAHLLPTPVLTGSGSTGSPAAASQVRSSGPPQGLGGNYRGRSARMQARTARTPPRRYNCGTSCTRSARLSGSVRVFQVDAFTSRRFSGNPAGVVLDADALSEAEMRAIAREINAGDTAFVLKPDAPDHELRLRFFTPRGEVGFVGPATLAAHAVLATLPGPVPAGRRQRSAGALVDVDLI